MHSCQYCSLLRRTRFLCSKHTRQQRDVPLIVCNCEKTEDENIAVICYGMGPCRAIRSLSEFSIAPLQGHIKCRVEEELNKAHGCSSFRFDVSSPASFPGHLIKEIEAG